VGRAVRLALAACAAALAACGSPEPAAPEGDAQNGKLLLRQYGCGGCHEIPGVAAARGKMGPPLAGIARQAYIAGVLPNDRANLAAFIRDPRIADPRIAMPAMGMRDEHLRDMVAYLYTLE